MKTRRIIPVLLLILAGYFAQGQSLRLNGYASYVFDDAVNSYYSNSSYYDGKINGGLLWGVGLEYMLHPRYGIELSYTRQDTKAPTYYWDNTAVIPGEKFREFDLAANWILISGIRYFPVNEVVEPWFGAGAGAAIFNVSNPTSGNSQTATKFAWTIKGGSNFWIADNFGLKFQAGLNSAVQAIGGGLYFGTGGVGTGVSTYSTLTQFYLGGGICLKMGH